METDNNVILIHLLEEWVKEMKEEIKHMHTCGDKLKKEVSNLTNEVNKISLISDSLTEVKATCVKRHDDHELRLRSAESVCHDIAVNKEISNLGDSNLETRIKSIKDETKKNSDN